ncbi:MAG: type II secretion system protein GspD [Hydrogenobaculum sp.]|nr:MAG: type II secretion system protein GspD [Hydrogenobaculum sp.]
MRKSWFITNIFSALLALTFGTAHGKENNKHFNNVVTLNFQDQSIDDIAQFMSKLTGKTIVVGINGNVPKITVSSKKPVSVEDAWHLFLTSLALDGYTVVKYKNFYKIVPIKEATSFSSSVTKKAFLSPSIETYIYFAHTNAQILLNAVRPFLSQYGNATVYMPSNALIISDIGVSVDKIQKLLKSIDIPNLAFSLKMYKTKDTDAVVKALSPLANPVSQKFGIPMVVSSVQKRHSKSGFVLVYAPKAMQASIKEIIHKINKSAYHFRRHYYVIPLQNASVGEMAKTLASLFGSASAISSTIKRPTPTLTGMQPNGPQTQPQNITVNPTNIVSSNTPIGSISLSDGTRIGFDRATNSVILYATKSQYENLKNLIKKLDEKRIQVLIAASVVEANLTKQLTTGVNWQALGKNGGIGFNPASLQTIYQGLLSGNFVVGVTSSNSISANVSGSTIIFPDLAVFLSLLEQGNGFKIISNPKVLTLDNEEAIIKEAQVYPYVTGTQYNINGYPILTYDYKDIGLELDVIPTVSKDNIRLGINLNLQDITGFTNTNVAGQTVPIPITTDRVLNSEVVVKSGQTVILGGLVSNNTIKNISGIPILQDIPVLGNLFKYQNRENKKSTLFIFITPYIIKSPEQLAKITKANEAIAHRIYESVKKAKY